jgi:hypothetical protein
MSIIPLTLADGLQRLVNERGSCDYNGLTITRAGSNLQTDCIIRPFSMVLKERSYTVFGFGFHIVIV